MNIRDFVGPFLLTFAFMLFFRNWWLPENASKEKTDFIAPVAVAEVEPLYTGLDFEKTNDIVHGFGIVTVQTDYGIFDINPYGASLSRVILFQGKDKRPFTVINQEMTSDPSYGNFVLVLGTDTPWYYSVDAVQEVENSFKVVCKAHTKEYSLTKTFIIDKHVHKIDVALDVTLYKNEVLVPRLIFSTPGIQETLTYHEDYYKTGGIFKIDSHGEYKKYPFKKFNEQQGFLVPQFFGLESKYFVTSAIQTAEKSIQRAYVKNDNGSVYAIVEGKKIRESTTQNYSFCILARDAAALYPEIAPLEKTFEYGFFGFFTKMMIIALKWVYELVHNYGLAIIIITCILKLALMPWTLTSARKMKIFKENEKRFNYMKTKVQHDPQALAKLTEEHMKENMSNLLSSQGPMLIQMPFIFGLSGVINNSLELQGAPFFGWIKDLSMPDSYHVLPVLFGIMLFLNFMASKGMTFKKFVVYLALTLFAVGWFLQFSAAFLLFLFVNMIFHVVQTFFAERLSA